MIAIASIDHVVLVVRDLEASLRFYEGVLGMHRIVFEGGRVAVGFGSQKLNLQPVDAQSPPVARRPEPGAGDLCFLLSTPLEAAVEHMGRSGFPILECPVMRTGAAGPIVSVYVRDPDGNLIELSVPVTGRATRPPGGAGPGAI